MLPLLTYVHWSTTRDSSRVSGLSQSPPAGTPTPRGAHVSYVVPRPLTSPSWSVSTGSDRGVYRPGVTGRTGRRPHFYGTDLTLVSLYDEGPDWVVLESTHSEGAETGKGSIGSFDG